MTIELPPSSLLPRAPGQGLSAEDFAFIAEFAQAEAGLYIPLEKAAMVASRLKKQANKAGIMGVGEYCDILRNPENSVERRRVLSALTTNVTSFLREAHHFDYLIEKIIPNLIAKSQSGEPIRIWSAGCSTGQEPYSIAMAIHQNWSGISGSNFKILATDIDHDVLNIAKTGIYNENQFGGIDSTWRKKYFNATSDVQHTGSLAVSQCIRDLVSFRHLNLVKQWPFNLKFDVIFCRNVVIYFSEETQHSLWPRFESSCKTGGTLFVGHSERVEPEGSTAFRQVGNTTYEKKSQSGETVQKGSF